MMPRRRYLLLLPALLFATTGVAAQQHALDRGSVQLAGSAGFTSSEVEGDDERTSTLFLSPRVRYFFLSGLAIGADVSATRTSRGDLSSSAYGIGPAVTYYFGAAATRVHPYVSANALFMRTNVDSPFIDRSADRRTFSVAGGVLAMLSPAVGITTELFYRIEEAGNETLSRDGNAFGVQLGVAAFVF